MAAVNDRSTRCARTERECPEPGAGIRGYWDRLIGPGATRGEIALQLSVALSGALAVPAYAVYHHLGWSWLQLAVAALLAFDLCGGVVTNATAPARRWYHREGRGFWQHLSFTAVHVHPFVVAWLFMGMDWTFAIVVYGYLIAAALATLAAPPRLGLPAAMALYAGGLMIGLYVLKQAPGMEWFVPVFYLKLLVGYLAGRPPGRP